MFINAVFAYKENEFKVEKCKIEKIIYLSEEEFTEFKKNMLLDMECIKENKDKMYIDENGIKHTIMITSKESSDGIIVESSGYDWARYSAYVPNVNEYIQLKLKDIANDMIKEGTEKTESGEYVFLVEELSNKYRMDIEYFMDDLLHLICMRNEIADIGGDDEEIELRFDLDYCPKVEEDEAIYDELESIKVLIVEPNKTPRRATILNQYEEIRRIVGGNIQTVPLTNNAELICNAEGKLMKLTGNRKIGEDIIAGTFIIVGADGGEEFISLTDKQIEEYEKRFWNPEEHSEEEVQEAVKINIYEM